MSKLRTCASSLAVAGLLLSAIAVTMRPSPAEAMRVVNQGSASTSSPAFGPIIPPATYVYAPSIGQSRSVSDNGNPTLLDSLPSQNNLQPWDAINTLDAGYWDASDPWVLIPLTTPMREPGPSGCSLGAYPCNVANGDTQPVGSIFQVSTWSHGFGIDYRFIAGAFGQVSQPLSAIGPGSRSYVGMQTELKVAKAAVLAGVDGGPPGTIVVTAFFMWHGEADELNASYGSQLATYQGNLNTDTRAITGQNRVGATCPLCTPILAVQPSNGQTRPNAPLSPQQMLSLTQTSSPGIYTAFCPTYAYPWFQGGPHNTNYGYEYGAECMAKAYWLSELWQAGQGSWPLPLAPTLGNAGDFVHVGNSVTVTLHHAVGNVVRDMTVYNPHQVGAFAPYWSNGGGWELCSGVTGAATTSPCIPGTNGTPVVITSVTIVNLGNGDVQVTINGASAFNWVGYAQNQDAPTLLDGGGYDSGAGFNATTGAPDGLGGQFRDSDCNRPAATWSGYCSYDWLAEFYEGGI